VTVRINASITHASERIIAIKRSVTFAAALASTLAVPAYADGFTLTSPDIAEGQHVFLFIGSLVTVTTLSALDMDRTPDITGAVVRMSADVL
jgi:hypothetical protein